MKKRAIFLDRDGVINQSEVIAGKPYAPRRVEDFKIFPEAPQVLEKLKQAGFLLIVATNQPDVGNGLVEREVVEEMNRQMCRALPIDDVQVCYVSQKEGSPMRKPAPGMLLEAAKKWRIDLEKSFMIGDRWSDVEVGKRAGCRTVLVLRNYSEKQTSKPDFTVNSLSEAAKVILENETVAAIV